MLTKSQKKEIAKELKGNIEGSKTSVVCDFKGLTVEDLSELRSQLREFGARMKVIKKTVMQIAIKDANVDLDVRKMEGQVAIVYGGEDEVCSPRILHKFAKGNDKLKILGGILEQKGITEAEVKNLANLPSKQELLAKVVGSMKAPINGFVGVLSGNLRKFIYALNAIKDSKENA
jgi:large subunit ribosomal protein L10